MIPPRVVRFVFLSLPLSAIWMVSSGSALADAPQVREPVLAQARMEPAATAIIPALIGIWESVTRSQGGIGQIIELDKDGAITRSVAAMVEFTYKVDGNRLLTSFTDAGTGRAQETASEIRFEGATLIESAPSREVRMTRRQAGRPADPPIVGVWSYPHEAGGTAFVMYTADGRMIFRLPIRSDRGRWSASGTQLTITLSGAKSLGYRIDGDRLVLTDDQKKEQQYRRAELVDYARP